MRLINADKLSAEMYHQAFEVDSDEQRWDSGCWIRYKMFERCLEKQPTINPMKWIPCSERLPEEDGQYLVTIRGITWNMTKYTSLVVTRWIKQEQDWWISQVDKSGGGRRGYRMDAFARTI